MVNVWGSECLGGERLTIGNHSYGNSLKLPAYLHLFNQTAVAGFLQVTLQVEGTTDASVSDHWFEDLGAVDLLPLPLALPQHVR